MLLTLYNTRGVQIVTSLGQHIDTGRLSGSVTCGRHRVPGNAIYRMDGLDERTLYGISASKTNLENEAFVTLGFRLHVVVLNDPVRRSVVHLCYSWLGAS